MRVSIEYNSPWSTGQLAELKETETCDRYGSRINCSRRNINESGECWLYKTNIHLMSIPFNSNILYGSVTENQQ